ncbi:MAG TPA: serine/threonine-protein kinase [Streptosporangiaceae bacterium]|nr:serine/threonine-protein kinase [Streptosporangiaceae bacterium]
MSETVAERVLAGRYRLLSRIGRGGMGTVWLARDEVLDREVAVKEVSIYPGLSDSERDVLYERTQREARATARLSHPGIVTVHDVVTEDGRPWIVMEYVKAQSLQEIIELHGPMRYEQVAELGRQLVGALRTAHAAGILHRDVKPDNVLLLREGREQRAVLTDFGIAQMTGDVTLTNTGLIIGSPAYIAPERAKGENAGPPSDLWALGATLYAAVDGKPPHQRTDAMSTLGAVLTIDAGPPRNGGPLSPVLLGLMERDPARRMTAETAADLLAQVAASGKTVAVAVPAAADHTRPDAFPAAPLHSEGATAHTTQPRPSQRRGLLVAIGLLVVVVVALGGLLVAHNLGTSGPAAVGTPPPVHTGSPANSLRSPLSKPPAKSPIPAGWQQVTGAGFTLNVPIGWTRMSGTRGPIWRDPASGAFVQVDQTPWTGDPAAHWRTWEVQVRRDGKLRGFKAIGVQRLDANTADVEFTYLTSSQPMHAVDRGVLVNGRPYALFISIPDGEWAAQAASRDNLLTSFHPQ